jgi:hypothetical protein
MRVVAAAQLCACGFDLADVSVFSSEIGDAYLDVDSRLGSKGGLGLAARPGTDVEPTCSIRFA